MTNMTIMTPTSKTETKRTDIWSVAEAKARFSEVLERARSGGPQTITRNGRLAVVVVSADEWERKTKRAGNLAEFFAASPLRGSKLSVRRVKGGLRKVILGTRVEADACHANRDPGRWPWLLCRRRGPV